MTDVDYLLIGGGLASAYCASELRRIGADGSVMLVGREPDPPYDRPPLSKDYLRGEASREDGYVNPVEWYEENGIELRTGTSVTGLEPEARSAKLQGGEEVTFGKALLATGANVNILRVPGSELDGIHYLRAYGNSDAIREDAGSRERVVLIGGSYIGTEVAASLTELGVKCTVVMLEDVALSRAFGDEAGRWFQDVLSSHGIEFIGGAEVEGFVGDGRVSGVKLGDGRIVECEAVVVGAGAKPDLMLAGRAGLEVDNGVICDATLQTSVEGIYAAGDICSYESEIHGRRLRIEHWDVALQQGRHAARAMAGDAKPFREVPYFFSDLSDWASLEYVGPAGDWDEIVWRGDREAGEWTAWYLKDDRLAAALAVGRSEDLVEARRFIAEGTDLGAREGDLADPGTDLAAI